MASLFSTDDSVILASIGVSSLLDLALLLPCAFEDYSKSSEPILGQMCNILVQTQSMRTGLKTLQIDAFVPEWDQYLKISIFNARPWHYGAFKSGKELLLHGKLGEYGGFLSLQNPKIIKELSGITAHFKLDLKDEKIIELKNKYLNEENLKEQGLNQAEIKLILDINKNDKTSMNLLNNLANNNDALEILKFLEIYNYTKKLNSKKTYFKAEPLKPNNIDKWLNSLPFVPTNDQINAINDIKEDLKSSIAKRRVVMGDVGSGKSLIMFGAALLAVPKKSIIMAPTSILAAQLYSEAKRLLPPDFGVILAESKDKKSDFKALADAASLIIGTHVLLYKDLPKAALIMIDEQHRFGSAQRHKIELLCSNDESRAHFIQFSATPIPRTLALINSNFVSYSFLKEIPFEKKIYTKIIKNADFAALLEHIKAQIKIGKQAIIVYPLVNESQSSNYMSLEAAAGFWQQRFERVFITHGKDKDKENIVADFAANGDILLSTTIIEVGISLPRLSTIVIVGAERLGLASLHQLRGRVGRNGGEGWCFLYTKMSNTPKRLIDFSNTLDGFEVANIDFKNREAGDILDGSIQHGSTFSFYKMEEHLAHKANQRLGLE